MLPPGELELVGEEGEVDVVGERRLPRQQQPPDALAVGRLREGEVDHEVEPPQEGLVDVLAVVRGQHDGAGVALHALQQVGDLEVRVAVVGVLDVRALAEQRVRLVEEEDRVGAVGGGEDAVEVLLGLPDVLRHHGRQVEPEDLLAEIGREHLGGHRLARARVAREERLDALVASPPCARSPNPTARGRGGGCRRRSSAAPRTSGAAGSGRPSRSAGRAAWRAARARRSTRGARRGRDRRRRGVRPLAGRDHLGDLGGLLDLPDREPELGRHVVDVLGARGPLPGRPALGVATARAPRR